MTQEESQSPGVADDLNRQVTHKSEKLDDLQLEAESIASALDGPPIDGEGEDGNANDLEKATTQATRTSHEPATRIVTAVDWTGADDPGNPMNWPMWKKTYHTFAAGSLAFAVTVGTSIISPAVPGIAKDFNVSREAAIVSITVYTLGLAFGPLIGAPISETFGRSVVYKSTGLLFILFLVGSGFSKSFASLIVCRLLAGTFGGPTLAIGAGTNADMYPQHVRAIAAMSFVMMPFLGPSIGPIIGGFVAQYKDWRWTQWCSIFIAVLAYAIVLPMHETSKKVILKRRAKKHGVEGPPASGKSGFAYAKILITVTLLRPLRMLATEPAVFFFSLHNAFTFGVLFCLFAAYPYTFETVYGFNTWQYGLAFIGVLIGVLLAVATGITIDRTVYAGKYRRALKEGKTAVAPEHRLYLGMLGAIGIPVGLFWFAWTARRDVHWISPILAGIPFAWGNLAIFLSAALFLIDVYGPLNGASAIAANGVARYTVGAVFPLFTFQMYERLTIPWATSLLGFVSLAMIPIPWVFFKYGPKIRAKSAYDTIKV